MSYNVLKLYQNLICLDPSSVPYSLMPIGYLYLILWSSTVRAFIIFIVLDLLMCSGGLSAELKIWNLSLMSEDFAYVFTYILNYKILSLKCKKCIHNRFSIRNLKGTNRFSCYNHDTSLLKIAHNMYIIKSLLCIWIAHYMYMSNSFCMGGSFYMDSTLKMATHCVWCVICMHDTRNLRIKGASRTISKLEYIHYSQFIRFSQQI